MPNPARGSAAGLILLFCASSLAAVSAPPPLLTRPALPGMVDARVNLKDSFQRSKAARASAATAGASAAHQAAANIVTAIGKHRRGPPRLAGGGFHRPRGRGRGPPPPGAPHPAGAR